MKATLLAGCAIVALAVVSPALADTFADVQEIPLLPGFTAQGAEASSISATPLDANGTVQVLGEGFGTHSNSGWSFTLVPGQSGTLTTFANQPTFSGGSPITVNGQAATLVFTNPTTGEQVGFMSDGGQGFYGNAVLGYSLFDPLAELGQGGVTAILTGAADNGDLAGWLSGGQNAFVAIDESFPSGTWGQAPPPSDPSPVGEPGSLAIMGSALLAFTAWRRRFSWRRFGRVA